MGRCRKRGGAGVNEKRYTCVFILLEFFCMCVCGTTKKSATDDDRQKRCHAKCIEQHFRHYKPSRQRLFMCALCMPFSVSESFYNFLYSLNVRVVCTATHNYNIFRMFSDCAQ